jgi:hypothetical protein
MDLCLHIQSELTGNEVFYIILQITRYLEHFAAI